MSTIAFSESNSALITPKQFVTPVGHVPLLWIISMSPLLPIHSIVKDWSEPSDWAVKKLLELPITSTFQVTSSALMSIFQTLDPPVISKSKSNLSAEAE